MGYEYGPLQDRHKLNCAETALLMCHSIGLLLDRISPQSFAEFGAAGVFSVEQLVWHTASAALTPPDDTGIISRR